MRDEKNCPFEHGQMCSCKPVRERNGDIVALIQHLSEKICDVEWLLDYTDIQKAEHRRLCRAGICRTCGGVLCHELDASDNLAGDDFLSAVYRNLYQLAGRDMSYTGFQNRFVKMFHQQDQPYVRDWLERLANRDACRMYRKTLMSESVTVYTIVRTGADADQGFFPEPSQGGSFLSQRRARMELQRLIREERAHLSSRYDTEEQGEDYWEASHSGYAAALFSRLEILTSELYQPPRDESPDSFDPAMYLGACTECSEQYKVRRCKEPAGECRMLSEARKALQAIQAEESEAQSRLLSMWGVTGDNREAPCD